MESKRMTARKLAKIILPTNYPKAVVWFLIALFVIMVVFRAQPLPHKTADSVSVVDFVKVAPVVAPIPKGEFPSKPLASPLPLHWLATKRMNASQKAKLAKARKPALKLASAKTIEAPMPEPVWDLEANTFDVVDTDTPLEALSYEGFAEVGLEPLNGDFRQMAFQMDSSSRMETTRLAVTEGTLVRDDFADLRVSIDTLQTELDQGALEAPVEKVLPNLDNDSDPLPTSLEVTTQTETSPPFVFPNEGSPLEVSTAEEKIAQPEELQPLTPEKKEKPEDPPLEIQDGEDEEPILASAGPVLVKPNLSPVLAGAGSVTTQFGPTRPTKPSLRVTTQPRLAFNNGGKTNFSDQESVEPGRGKILGKISWDSYVDKWVEKNKGHVELRLEPVSEKNQGNTLFVNDYAFPDPEFEIDATGLTGRHRLIASFYTPMEVGRVAQIVYEKEINLSHPKEKIRFNIRRKDLEVALSSKETWTAPIMDVLITVFEGASGNHREPKAIPGARVSIAGFPEWGTTVTDSEGNVRIQGMAPHSEYVVYAEAPGYYPVRTTLPVFSSHAFLPIYLVEREKVETITKYFTKSAQKSGTSIVFGRIFDAKTRVPKAGEEVLLSARKGRALYIDALPNKNLKTTTETGLFTFFNVNPGMRSLLRSGNPIPLLFSADADRATYVEIGRSGKSKIQGRVTDPFRNTGVPSEIRIVGNPNVLTETNDQGQFDIVGVDLPQGVITIEVKAKDYPVTWHTIPWNAKEPLKRGEFYLMESEIVEAVRKNVAKLPLEKNVGTVVGGADPQFFKTEKCLTLSLEAVMGGKVEKSLGPFSLGTSRSENPSCLTAKAPGFAFVNLTPGEYLLKWIGKENKTLRTHLVRVGPDRVSIVVN